MAQQLHIILRLLCLSQEGMIGHENGSGEIVGKADAGKPDRVAIRKARFHHIGIDQLSKFQHAQLEGQLKPPAGLGQ